MGSRGPLPQDDGQRKLTGRRRGPQGGAVPEAVRRILRLRAEKLERRGELLLDGVKRGTARTKNNGVQVHPQLAAALRLFEAADRIWQRLGRLAPERPTGGAPTPPKSKWDGLL